MILRSGIPTLAEISALTNTELFAEILAFDEAFSRNYANVIRRHALRWGKHVMRHWSRRWEYPYVVERIGASDCSAVHDRPVAVLDAGSGVTFLPYFLCRRNPNVRITCVDSVRSYTPAFQRLNLITGVDSVTFRPATLQDMPLRDGSFDAIYCVSVLEHTGNYAAVLDEMLRVLTPGGELILTFDISLDGKDDISPAAASELLAMILQRFEFTDRLDAQAELARLADPMAILSTDAVRAADPSLLPWKWPTLKSLYDLLCGRGWTGGFFSLACYCLHVQKPAENKRPP